MKKKLTFYFDLPDDLEAYNAAIRIDDLYSANYEALQDIRAQIKYGDTISQDTVEALERVRDILYVEGLE